MSRKQVLTVFGVIALVISLPFVVIHLMAAPNEAEITPLQHLMAAVANFFGPWGVAIVRLVEFPNAGLRSFSWLWAVGLTILGVMLVVLATRTHKKTMQWLFAAGWTVFAIIWFGLGLTQIADGLL